MSNRNHLPSLLESAQNESLEVKDDKLLPVSRLVSMHRVTAGIIIIFFEAAITAEQYIF